MSAVRAIAFTVLLSSATVTVAQSPDAPTPTVPVREYPETSISSLPRWTVAGPSLSIGQVLGEPHYEFNRAAWPWRLSDGRIVVANDGVELRIYSGSGTFLETVGRRGQGPGEYRELAWVWRGAGDTLRVVDCTSRRVDVRAPDGKVARVIRMVGCHEPHWLPDGSALVAVPKRPDPDRPGLQKGSLELRHMRSDGTLDAPVAVQSGGWTSVSGRDSWRDVRLSGWYRLASGARGAVYIDDDYLTLHWFDVVGRPNAISRVVSPRIRATDGDIRAYERFLLQLRARNPQVRAEGAQPPPIYAEYVPQVSRLRVDREGNAWVQRWARWGTAMAEWIVFAPFGGPIAAVNLPAGFNPYDIGSDYVLGIATDNDGVQFVQQFQLRRR